MRSFDIQRNESNRPEQTGARAFAPLASDNVQARVLAATTQERVTIPDGAKFVAFSCLTVSPVDFAVKFGDSAVTAAFPAGDVADGSASALNPAARAIPDGTTHISVIASGATTMTLEFWG